jgi:hypothetical protein
MIPFAHFFLYRVSLMALTRSGGDQPVVFSAPDRLSDAGMFGHVTL